MKIHSDVLTTTDLQETVSRVGGMYIDECTPIPKPKIRARGWNILAASTTRTRRRNNGKNGAGDGFAASRDDYGRWFARLYEIDPNAQICCYKNKEDFDTKTYGRYRRTLAGL